jgi:hypothetical protein
MSSKKRKKQKISKRKRKIETFSRIFVSFVCQISQRESVEKKNQ